MSSDLKIAMSATQVAIYSTGALIAYFVLNRAYKEYTSPNRKLSGPPSKSWIYGNLRDILNAENSVLQEKWVEEYGPTIRYHGLLGETRFYTTDIKAIQHILANAYDFPKPARLRPFLASLFGDGLLNAEGERHRFQRKVMNPAFGPIQIRQLTTIFVEKAVELRDALKTQIHQADSPDGTARIEILFWLTKMTLDVIGRAGFNYEFNAIERSDDDPSELNVAFATIFSQTNNLRIWGVLRNRFPFLRILPGGQNEREIADAKATMDRIGLQLLKDSRRAIAEEEKAKTNSIPGARDLLSLLIKSNMNEKQRQQLSDEDVVAQVPTFLVAGHETTSTATTWALFALTQRPDIQTKLRQELFSVPTDTPTMEQLSELPYLDAVVKETLRIHAPVPSTMRESAHDCLLPLSIPVNGKDHVEVRKGQSIFIPILALNRSKSLWGEDASEFNPDRWLNGSIDTSLPGIWGNMMTFLGGPRSCIGYKFALIEMKALIFTLVRAFDFDLAVPREEVTKRTMVVQRPFVKSEMGQGSQLPLLMKVYNPDS